MLTDVLMAVNSHGLEFPSIHSTWLLDYKMKGTNSYVFKDKRILHELYESPISANDADIQAEAFNYVAANRESILGWWMSRNYGLSGVSGLDSCQSISSIVANSDAVAAIPTSDFKDIFFESESVVALFTTTAGLKAVSGNNSIMTTLENSDTFKTAVTKNPDIVTVTKSAGYGSGNISVSNVYVVSSIIGVASNSASMSNVTGASGSFILHGSTTSLYSAVANKFVKSATLGPTIISGFNYNKTSNMLKYIQLDNVV